MSFYIAGGDGLSEEERAALNGEPVTQSKEFLVEKHRCDDCHDTITSWRRVSVRGPQWPRLYQCHRCRASRHYARTGRRISISYDGKGMH